MGCGFEPHWRVVSLSKNINPSLVLVQLRKTRPFITERLLMGRIESNKTKKKREQGANAVNGGDRVLSASIAFIMLMENLENH